MRFLTALMISFLAISIACTNEQTTKEKSAENTPPGTVEMHSNSFKQVDTIITFDPKTSKETKELVITTYNVDPTTKDTSVSNTERFQLVDASAQKQQIIMNTKTGKQDTVVTIDFTGGQ